MLKKYRNRFILFLSLFVVSFTNGISQDNPEPLFAFEEDSLNEMFAAIKQASSDSEKTRLNKALFSLMEEMIYDERSFTYPFDSVKHLGIITSPDKLLRIYTWNLAFADYTNRYYGFVQYYLKEDEEYRIYPLIDKSDEIEEPERATLTDENWFGALYYDIVETKDKRHKYYTLLGWDGNNELTTKKIIDVLYFTQAGRPRFGTNIFYTLKGEGRRERKYSQKRIIFEYSSKVNMVLRYDDKLNMIVFDHLSPSESHLKGNYQYYGPDWSYDALEFEKGKWQYVVDINPRNPKPKTEKQKWQYSEGEDFFKAKKQKPE
ncbi:MAG: hypothetical protein K9H64_21480 [Bacteroidales bacterium]|nr:hypothetical protein [Bacteroidales bacterium]MCF8458613.1 hypothetical protein [Bacteroidales bacterium]